MYINKILANKSWYDISFGIYKNIENCSKLSIKLKNRY